MPTRRLVVALTVLLLGVFGVGIVTALNRAGDDGGTPRAQPSASPSPAFTPPPSPTTEPTTEPDETTEPTGSPAPQPTASPTGVGVPGPGGPPRMPNTGLPGAVALAGSAALAAAYGARRRTR